MNPFFSPRALERVRAVIEAEVEELLAGLPARGTTDLMSTFAQLLPINMLCTWLGIPRNDRERCRSWAASIGRVLVSVLNPELIRSMADAILACDAYVREQVAQRHRAPQDDLLTALLEAEFDGRPIDDDELVANVILLLGATYETTVNMIGNSILALLRHPEQLELLRSDRSLLTGAVEELLRYDSPAQLHGRFNYDELEVGGRLIPPESRLILLIGAANRDPDRFEDPDVLDVTRYDAKPLSFGGGPHYCLGAGVARLESQICLSLLLDRFPRLRLVEEKIRWRSEPVALRALRALPVELDAA
jgi:cytochrome P450